MTQFHIYRNTLLSNLSGRYVLTPDNPLYTRLVTKNSFIIKRDIKSTFISTADLKLVKFNQGTFFNHKTFNSNRWINFGISKDRNLHDIVMPKLVFELIKLTPDNFIGTSRFGSSIAISSNIAIIGARNDDSNVGAAYVFTNSNGFWVQTQKLTPTGAVGNGLFGSSVAINGNVAIIGASDDNSNVGAAYIFTNNNGLWVQTQKLTPTGSVGNGRFGSSVAINGNVAIIGASADNSNVGAAYVFANNNGLWVQTQKLTPTGALGNGRFGLSLEINGNVAIIGAHNDDSFKGAAYVFTNNNGLWVQTQKLTPTGSVGNGRFGSSVAIDDDIAIIGATDDDSNVGAAYVFANNNGLWVQTQKLTPTGSVGEGQFGLSVAISGNIAVIGAYIDDSFKGAAYVFANNGLWVQTQKLTPTGGVGNVQFGSSAAINGNIAIIGGPGDTGDIGAAYIKNGLVYKGNIKVWQ